MLGGGPALSGQAEARISANTVRFIASFEGFAPACYNDPAGHATIGYGHLIHLGPCTRRDRKAWGTLSPRQARQLLRTDLVYYRDQVRERIWKRLPDKVWTALISYTYNLGPGYLDFVENRARRPDTWVAWQFNRGNFRRAANQMRIYNRAEIAGKLVVLEGLRRRREAERRLIFEAIGIQP